MFTLNSVYSVLVVVRSCKVESVTGEVDQNVWQSSSCSRFLSCDPVFTWYSACEETVLFTRLVDVYVLFLDISSGNRMVDILTLVHRDMKQLEHDTVAIGCSSRNLLVTLIPLISLKYLDEHVINVWTSCFITFLSHYFSSTVVQALKPARTLHHQRAKCPFDFIELILKIYKEKFLVADVSNRNFNDVSLSEVT